MTVESTFTLTPETTAATSEGVSTQGITLGEFPDFLGYGLLIPFRREASDFANGGGIDHLQSMIEAVLGTRAGSEYTEGELPWRSEFGSLLHFLRHKNNTDILHELARVYVADALARWIPQIRLKDVFASKETGEEGEENVLLLRIVYDVVGVRQTGNSVLIPNVSQSITLVGS